MNRILIVLLAIALGYMAYLSVWIGLHLDEQAIGKKRDSLYFEFQAGAGKTFSDLLKSAYGDGVFHSVCFYDAYGLDRLVGPKRHSEVMRQFNNRDYRSSDLVWPILLVGGSDHRIIYMSHYGKPLGLESGPHCFKIDSVEVEMDGPRIRDGAPRIGSVIVRQKTSDGR